MIAIFKREVRSSFHGMIGYVLTAFMLAATAIYFIALNLGYGLTDFGSLLLTSEDNVISIRSGHITYIQ